MKTIYTNVEFTVVESSWLSVLRLWCLDRLLFICKYIVRLLWHNSSMVSSLLGLSALLEPGSAEDWSLFYLFFVHLETYIKKISDPIWFMFYTSFCSFLQFNEHWDLSASLTGTPLDEKSKQEHFDLYVAQILWYPKSPTRWVSLLSI